MIITELNMLNGADSLLSSMTSMTSAAENCDAARHDKLVHEHLASQACASAHAAFDSYCETTPVRRADLLDRIADNVEMLGDRLAELLAADTGIARTAATAKVTATVEQLRFIGDLVRSGSWLGSHVNRLVRGSKIAVASDIRQRSIGIGPVAIFSTQGVASLYSMIGDNTACALAAGCPVVLVASPAHPEISLLVAMAAMRAIADGGLHVGVLSLLPDEKQTLAARVAGDHRIAAVACMGSPADARMLKQISASREEQIPVYCTGRRFKPMIVLPMALSTRAEMIGTAFAASLKAGRRGALLRSGLVLTLGSQALDVLMDAVANATGAATPPHVDAATWMTATKLLGLPIQEDLPDVGRYTLYSLSQEAGSPSASAPIIVISCPDLSALREMIRRLGSQASMSLQADEEDLATARSLLPQLEKQTERICLNRFERDNNHADALHGSSFTPQLDSRGISSGNLAIARFLRPVAYLDFPETLLPDALKSANCGSADANADAADFTSDFSAYVLGHARSKSAHH